VHSESNPTSTTYLVALRREQIGDVLVDLPGPPSLDGRHEAARIARERHDAGEAIAWAAVGDPAVASAEPLGTGAVA
jgi:hypothetical protein